MRDFNPPAGGNGTYLRPTKKEGALHLLWVHDVLVRRQPPTAEKPSLFPYPAATRGRTRPTKDPLPLCKSFGFRGMCLD